MDAAKISYVKPHHRSRRFRSATSADSEWLDRRNGMKIHDLGRWSHSSVVGAAALLLAFEALSAGQSSTSLVSRGSDGGSLRGDAQVSPGVISGDGRFVAFSTFMPFIGIDTCCRDVFVHDRITGETARISNAAGGGQADGGSAELAISPDGRYVLMASDATNLVAGDSNDAFDDFLHDRTNDVTVLVGLSSAGVLGNSGSLGGSISPDGRYCAFVSASTNLVATDRNDSSDVFVRDLVAGTTEIVSVSTAGDQGNGESW